MPPKITHLYLKPKHSQPMQAVPTATAETNKGLVGDTHHGVKKRQVLFVEKETLDEFGLAPGQVRENVTVIGIKLAGLPAGTRLQVGDALFEVTDDCAPCELIESIRPGLRTAIEGRRGTWGRGVSGSEVKVGDEVGVVEEERQGAD